MAVAVTVYESKPNSAQPRTQKIMRIKSSALTTGEWLFCTLEVLEDCRESYVDVDAQSMNWDGTGRRKQKLTRTENTVVTLLINGVEAATSSSSGGRSILHQNVILGTIPKKVDQKRGSGIVIADLFWLPKSTLSPPASPNFSSTSSTSTVSRMSQSIFNVLKSEPPTLLQGSIVDIWDSARRLAELSSDFLFLQGQFNSASLSNSVLASLAKVISFSVDFICIGDEKAQEAAFRALQSAILVMPKLNVGLSPASLSLSFSTSSLSSSLLGPALDNPTSNGEEPAASLPPGISSSAIDNLSAMPSAVVVGSAAGLAHTSKALSAVRLSLCDLIELVHDISSPGLFVATPSVAEALPLLSSPIAFGHDYPTMSDARSVWKFRVAAAFVGMNKFASKGGDWGAKLFINENMLITGVAAVTAAALSKGVIDHTFFRDRSSAPRSHGNKDHSEGRFSPDKERKSNTDASLQFNTPNASSGPSYIESESLAAGKLVSFVCGGGWPPVTTLGRAVELTPRALFLHPDPRGLEQVLFPTTASILHISQTRPGVWLRSCVGAYVRAGLDGELVLPRSPMTILPSTEMVTSRDPFPAVEMEDLMSILSVTPVASYEYISQTLRKIVLAPVPGTDGATASTSVNANASTTASNTKKKKMKPVKQGVMSPASLSTNIGSLPNLDRDAVGTVMMPGADGIANSTAPNASIQLIQVLSHLRCFLMQLTRVHQLHGEQRSKQLLLLTAVLERDLENIVSIAATDPIDAITAAFDAGSFKGAQLDVLKNLLKEGDVCFLEKISLRLWKEIKFNSNVPQQTSSTESDETLLQMTALAGDIQITGTKLRALAHFPSARLQGVALGKMSGRWYYECTLLSDGLMQIGWANSSFRCDPVCGQGVGTLYLRKHEVDVWTI